MHPVSIRYGTSFASLSTQERETALMSSFRFSLLLSILAIFATGCGTALEFPRVFRAPGSSSGHFISSSQGFGACSATANVLPIRDVALDGRDRYIACPDSASLFKIRLWGESSASTTQLCVFPAITEPTGQIRYQRDDQGRPQVICGPVDPDYGSDFIFEDVTYDSIFVVPVGSRTSMISCLTAQNPAACPHYSFGQFRQ
ncbi:MAG: hypothetical protein ACK5QT_01735 [Oligoflexia bacterium]